MKKIFTMLFIALLPVSAFAEKFTVSGEVKTGVFWQKVETTLDDPKIDLKMHSQGDDAGNYEGRFRLNVEYVNSSGTLGFKTRIQWEDWQNEKQIPEVWPYAFGYGNFFNNQLTVSIGKLGSSPWGTGGPEMWKELEMGRSGGARIEFKPAFIPEKYGKLNIGFVLNGPEAYTDAGFTRDPTIWDLLLESVIGVSYIHEYFLVRFAYRLDSEMDIRNRGTSGVEGGQLIYRVEEHALEKLLPGLKIWALGFVDGVGAEDISFLEHKHWVFAEYAPEKFTAQIRLGLEGSADRNLIFIKPVFYYKLFNLIEVGALFGYGQDFGAKIYPDSPYSYLEFEPKIQVNFAPGAYVAFVYNWKLEYAFRDPPPFKQTQWMNLRLGIYF